MTDNDVVKALECCSVNPMGYCKECPLLNDFSPCGITLTRNALDLINRQKAELERKDIEIDILIKKKEALRDEVAELKAEVERLENAYKQCAWERDAFSDNAEAIKEFAEKLKEYFPSIAKAIDHTAEELIGK